MSLSPAINEKKKLTSTVYCGGFGEVLDLHLLPSNWLDYREAMFYNNDLLKKKKKVLFF